MINMSVHSRTETKDSAFLRVLGYYSLLNSDTYDITSDGPSLYTSVKVTSLGFPLHNSFGKYRHSVWWSLNS